MTSDIVLGSALRNTLLSNIQTQRSLDQTTLRLATGLQVNSALDNPQNFFAAEALSNRSKDLQRLLDGIGQSIQTVRETDAGISALSSLAEQAEAVAQEAVELNRSAPTEARTVGNVDLTTVADLTQLNGINNGDQIFISTRDDTQTGLSIAPLTQQAITINNGDNIDQIVAEINSIANFNVEANVDINGQLEIRGTEADEVLNIRFDSALATTAADLELANALGFSEEARLLDSGFGGLPEVQFSVVSARQLESFQLFTAAGTQVAQRSDRISQLSGENGALIFFGLDSAQDVLNIGVNGGSQESIVLDGNQTIQGLIDTINNGNLSDSLEADFDEEEGRIIIRAINENVDSIQNSLTSDAVALAFFGFNIASPIVLGNTDADSIQLGTAAGPDARQLAQLESDYNNIRDQIDNLVEDANYRGINLLGGDDLETAFDEDRDNTLITEGEDFTALGLGIERADFDTLNSSAISVDQARAALENIRDFGQSIANDFSIIQTRQTFTETTINTLDSGSDDLTVADQNEEGANLLASQTRQALGITALSFASQSQSSVLLLF